MKRKLLTCGLLACVLLSGCGNSNESKIKDTQSTAVDTEQEVSTNETNDTEIVTEQVADTEETDTETTGTETNEVADNESGNNSSISDKVTHTHKWEPVTTTVHHEAVGHYEDVVVKEAWVEEVPVTEMDNRRICNEPTCAMDLTDLSREQFLAHVEQHALNGEISGHHTIWIEVQVGKETINHPAVTESKWIEDKPAYDEEVTTYKCDCGAIK